MVLEEASLQRRLGQKSRSANIANGVSSDVSIERLLTEVQEERTQLGENQALKTVLRLRLT